MPESIVDATTEKSAADHGCFLTGIAIAQSQLITGTSKAGKSYTLVKTQVLAGTQFAQCTNVVPQGMQPRIYSRGQEVRFLVMPRMDDKGVLTLEVQPA